ncbi:MAG: glutamine--fructose-6-phosphate transaminase (isomerizing) [Ichthyobacteriaceae bacterium]|nr:glutamine--fructose-6-phosphate transaminase (isomerizing) [Ichthyobacteriaceae bacterium]
MCGIVGYIGHRKAYPIVINGLKRLEYRGYDSAGVAIANGSMNVIKKQGKVIELENEAKNHNTHGTICIGHTRWATHGEPSDRNSHPHASNSGKIVLIHNGIIENYDTIKAELIGRGYVFHSDTDTEVLVNLIEDIKIKNDISIGRAVQLALTQIIGAYAIAVYDTDRKEELVVAKLGSPLAIGIGENFSEYFIGSDASPFIEYTKNAIYLEDGEMAVIKPNEEIKVRKIQDGTITESYIQELELNLEQIEKGGYDHFMIKEIHEQPEAVADTLRGKVNLKDSKISISGIRDNIERFKNANRIIIVGCGTSWHAGLVAEYLFEDLARIPVEVEYGSEFRYRNPIITEKDIVIAISQSGETADTLAAIKMAKEKGAFVYGVCNVVGSTIARETDAGTYTHAGPEIGVASTKAFTTQITVLAMMAIKLGQENGALSKSRVKELLKDLQEIPKKIEETLKSEEAIKEIAKVYKDSPNFLYLGRGYNFPSALEGALKLKEISYIHAEGYPAAEMKHGPIALIDEKMPVVVIATKKGYYEKILSNVQELKARKGKIIAVVNKGDTAIRAIADHCIEMPQVAEELSTIISTIPLQLLSYHIAIMRGCNVDQPRNLAKSVTVE